MSSHCFLFMKMDFSNKSYDDSSKENAIPGFNAPAVQRSKRRSVLGLLSENEPQGRPFHQVSQTTNQLRLCSVMALHRAYLCLLSRLSVCRPANFLYTARPLTDPTSNHAAGPPAPALTCAWRRPVKSSSQHLDSPWAQITPTLGPRLCKMMTQDFCWT